ncbi:radical SAM/SPASM domain-containing protein [Bacteroides sp. 519]|uniref:radical SAM/SPASM domain-containing protein n=1 Tax=Bacteroides sp. 519 TaxID=2302937 RepID=UPI0013D4C72F|nr:radical SAM protein [Bacteroides sp. 519]NDV57279.1 SPASM domain-containing protein [Bacteroides sp. 519]
MKIIRKNVWRTYPERTEAVVKWSFWNDIIPYNEEVICLNTRSGAIIVLSKEDYSKYKEQPWLVPDIFVQFGIVVPNNIDEKKEWIVEYKHEKKDTSFLDLTILLTLQCQFKCIYCFEGEKSNKALTNETCIAIKSFLEKRAGLFNKLHITWFGGEPLLEINRIHELSSFILEFCKKHNIYYYADITTNGYALNFAKCDILINKCNIKRFIITVDGTADIHNKRRPLLNGTGTFDVIRNNIATLVNIGAEVTIRVTIDKTNVNHIKKFIDWIADSELFQKVGLVFVRTIDYLFTPDDIKSTIYTVEEFAGIEMDFIQYAHSRGILKYTTPGPCPLGGCIRNGDIVIGTKGEIYKCLDTIGDEQWITGHISKNNEYFQADWYQDWLSWEPSNNIACKECKLQPLCNGGCPHNALFSSKKHGTNNQCPEWKSNYKEKTRLYVTEKIKEYKYEEI